MDLQKAASKHRYHQQILGRCCQIMWVAVGDTKKMLQSTYWSKSQISDFTQNIPSSQVNTNSPSPQHLNIQNVFEGKMSNPFKPSLPVVPHLQSKLQLPSLSLHIPNAPSAHGHSFHCGGLGLVHWVQPFGLLIVDQSTYVPTYNGKNPSKLFFWVSCLT